MFKLFSRITAKKYSDIDFIINKEQLIELFNNTYKSDLDAKLRIISNLLNLGFIDISRQYLDQVFLQFSDSVYQNIRWYNIQLTIAIEENNDFNVKTISKRFVDDFKKPKYYYDFITSNEIKKQIEIYNKEILPQIYKIIKTKLSDFCLITYMWSKFQNQEHIKLPKVEKKFISRINDINIKTKHSIQDILFVENISNAIITYCNQNPFIINKFFSIFKITFS